MNIEEVKKTVNYLLDNNLRLVEQGMNKIAISLSGVAGVGKTSILREIAEERGAKYVRINLAECEEIGDLLGVPCKEYIMHKEGEEKWINEKVIDRYVSMGWELCEYCEPRMSYAVPSWVPKDENEEVLLNLDDFSRATSLFIQATMSLIQFGEYISWKLPKKCHLLLTENPDNGEYSVCGMDAAQKSRYITLDVDFDIKVFAAWMDRQGMRSELINFALMNPEIFDRSQVINSRSYTLFANAISGIDDFEKIENAAMISCICKGCFGDQEGVVSGLFTQFIHNRLNKLILPQDILQKDWEEVKDELTDCIYVENNYRADIASTIVTRFIIYLQRYLTTADNEQCQAVVKRITELCLTKKLIAEDLVFRMVKTLYRQFDEQLSGLLNNKELRRRIIE